jgi:hypothetical protein
MKSPRVAATVERDQLTRQRRDGDVVVGVDNETSIAREMRTSGAA